MHVLVLLLATACGGGSKLPVATLSVAGHEVTVEIADDEQERALGLMYRDHLAADRGMLFVYPDAKPRSFWMKNTRIPLSIAYLDAQGRIVHLADMQPLSTKTTPSEQPAQYALEVNKGWFAEHGIEVGAKVEGLPGR